jgi:hypothetical protein
MNLPATTATPCKLAAKVERKKTESPVLTLLLPFPVACGFESTCAVGAMHVIMERVGTMWLIDRRGVAEQDTVQPSHGEVGGVRRGWETQKIIQFPGKKLHQKGQELEHHDRGTDSILAQSLLGRKLDRPGIETGWLAPGRQWKLLLARGKIQQTTTPSSS